MMRIRSLTVGMLMLSFLPVAPVFAQQSVISKSDLSAAMAAKAEVDKAKRAQVLEVLQDERAREIIARTGFDLTTAEEAVATLDGEDLATAAASADLLQTTLAGESQTVTISVTALLLIIIIVLLIA